MYLSYIHSFTPQDLTLLAADHLPFWTAMVSPFDRLSPELPAFLPNLLLGSPDLDQEMENMAHPNSVEFVVELPAQSLPPHPRLL